MEFENKLKKDKRLRSGIKQDFEVSFVQWTKERERNTKCRQWEISILDNICTGEEKKSYYLLLFRKFME